jgi:type IV secretion system protein VirD4
MKQFLYQLHVFFSWLGDSPFVKFLFPQKQLHSARYMLVHEQEKKSIPRAHILKKLPAIFLAAARFDRVLCVRPTKEQDELGNVLFIGKTRSGKGLAIETNLLIWPFSVIVYDIKGRELYLRTKDFREKGLGGKVFVLDPSDPNTSNQYDPFENFNTESKLQSAAKTLLHRDNEGENAIFTERAITMLVQIFIAAKLEGYRLLPYAYYLLSKGLPEVAKTLQEISRKHDFTPNLATVFLDMTYAQAVQEEFKSRFLNDCYSTMTTRMKHMLTRESVLCFMGSDFTAKDIITSKTPISLYLCWPEQHLLALSPLIQLITDSLINGMTGYYDSVQGKGCFRVLKVFDEAFRMGIPKLYDYATTVCGRGISLLVSAQSDSQIYAAFGQYNGEVFKEQFDHIVNYRPAPAANRTAHAHEESLGYTSGFAQSKTDHEHGTSEGESEQKIPLMPAHECKRMKKTQVIVEIDGEWSTIAERLDHRNIPELQGRLTRQPSVVTALAERPRSAVYPPSQPIALFQLERS